MIGNCCKLTVIFTAGNPFVDDTGHRQAKRLRRDFLLLRNYEEVLGNRNKSYSFLLNDQCLDMLKKMIPTYYLLGQWLNFKLFGITYLVGKIKFKPFFFRVHWLSGTTF